MKRRPLDIAIFFLFLAMVVAGLVILVDPPPPSPPGLAPGIVSIQTSDDLSTLNSEGRFSLILRSDRPLYVAVWTFCGREAQRLFPPLSIPEGQPWPLPADEGEGIRLPFGEVELRAGPPESSGHVVVFTREDALPHPRQDIVAAKDNAAREVLLFEHDQHFFRFEVAP